MPGTGNVANTPMRVSKVMDLGGEPKAVSLLANTISRDILNTYPYAHREV